jgi:hypothetical protein
LGRLSWGAGSRKQSPTWLPEYLKRNEFSPLTLYEPRGEMDSTLTALSDAEASHSGNLTGRLGASHSYGSKEIGEDQLGLDPDLGVSYRQLGFVFGRGVGAPSVPATRPRSG